MSTILTIAGIFAGIGVFLSAMYMLVQALLAQAETRWMNLACFVLILVVMGALMERVVDLARILAVPLFLVAGRVLMLEQRWYKIFPVLVMIFSVALVSGYVALN